MDKNLPEHGSVYRDIKHPRLEYKMGMLTLILPKTLKSLEQILEKYQRWIKRKQQAITEALEEAKTKAIILNRTEKPLRALVNMLAQKYQKERGITIK